MPTPQNGQTHLNNLLATANKLFECVWPFMGLVHKGLMRKTSRIVYLEHLEECFRSPLIPRYPRKFHGSCYNIQFKPCATSTMELFGTKKGNSWKLLLTVVTESSMLNVAGLLDATLRDIGKFRFFLRQ